MTTTQQPALLIEEPPAYEDRDVAVADVLRDPWGAPPDDFLKRNVEMNGLMFPVIFEDRDGGLRIVEGRRRFQAAVDAGFETVPGRVLVSNVGVGVHALTLAGNAVASHNRLMDLRAVEEIMVTTGEKDHVEIARRARIPLRDIKKILEMQALIGELRDAGMEGKFGNGVAVAASKLDLEQQRELVKRLNANGTITMKDITEVKKSSVTAHQRTLPGDNVKKRAEDALRKARNEVFLQWGENDVTEAIDRALQLLDGLEAED